METTKKPLILVVDDTPQNVQVIGNILYSKGYNINISSSGAHALQSVKSELPDLILLDIQMPEMDGFEVCKIIKLNPLTKDIPVIFLTAVSDSENILHGFELGAVDYITKPFNAGELTMRVATHIELKLAKEKLIEMNATKDKFFSIISHDLRNPVFAIKFLLNQLVSQYESFEKEELLNYLKELNTASENLGSLLEKLLLWSKSQWGVLEISPKKLNLKSIIEKEIAYSKVIATNKNIEIKITFEEEFIVIADEMMLSTVIINLLTNAIKFTNNHGLIKIGAKVNKEHIEVSIKDCGKGINEEQLKKLFTIDSGLSFQGSNNENIHGLGLVLCKEFTTLNGGEIFVTSEIGKGSTFSFTVKKF